MPWKDTRVEDERMKFLVAWLDEESGWSMRELCDAFGVSRKSGYKWVQRYRAGGVEALRDQPRAPHRHPNATPAAVVKQLIAARRRHPTWGARKLLISLKRGEPDLAWPAASTGEEILKRHGLVRPGAAAGTRCRWGARP